MRTTSKDKCAKYRDPILLGVHKVKRRKSGELDLKEVDFYVYDTLGATYTLNHIGGVQGRRFVAELGYESQMNEDNYWRLVKI